MDIVIDTSAILAVIVGDVERKKIINVTGGNTLIGPGLIPWEIGNAFSTLYKQQRLSFTETTKGLSIFNDIPLRYIEPDFVMVLELSKKHDISAHEAYFFDCALRYKSPLLTLDQRLKAIAENIRVNILEV